MSVSIHELQACEALAPSNLNNSLAFTIFSRGREGYIVPARVTHLSGIPSRKGAKKFPRTRGTRKSFIERTSARDDSVHAITGKLTCIITSLRTSGKTWSPSLMKFSLS